MPTDKRRFGSLRKLPSGNVQARYTGPDGATYRAPMTFRSAADADAWLVLQRADIARGLWTKPDDRAVDKLTALTFGPYAADWLAARTLKPRTRVHYQSILVDHLLRTFADVALADLTPTMVRSWHVELGTRTGPTMRSHAYSLLRTIANAAVADELIATNPCRIRGAGNAKRVKKIKPATIGELEAIAAAVPGRYQLMVLLAAWCGLRFGELAELRRVDVNVSGQLLHITRAVARVSVDGRTTMVIGTPKSDAGTRDVAIPPHLMPMVKAHLKEHAGMGRDALLFPARGSGEHLAPSTLARVFYPAREAAGRPDLRFHDLRHTGAVLAAVTGATLAELMGRLGHSTPGAAMRYQHAASDRDKVIADALSELAKAAVVLPITDAGTPRARRQRVR